MTQDVESSRAEPAENRESLRRARDRYEGHQFIASPLSKVSSPEPLTVLDIGAGAAGFARYHFPHSRLVLSTDITRNASTDLLCSATALPFHDGTFDLVLCLRVLQHVSGDRQAIHEIHRVVRRNGMAILAVGNRRSWTMVQGRMGNPSWRGRIPYRVYHPYTVRELVGMMKDAGFANVGFESAVFLPDAVKKLPFSLAASVFRLGAAIDRVATALPILRGAGTNIVAWGMRS